VPERGLGWLVGELADLVTRRELFERVVITPAPGVEPMPLSEPEAFAAVLENLMPRELEIPERWRRQLRAVEAIGIRVAALLSTSGG
jgi:hypothetical protein